jgi:hypothetical protein
MRWIFSVFRLRSRPPAWRELPTELLKALIFGLATGPLFAAFFLAIARPAVLAAAFSSVHNVAWMMIQGAVYSLCFYVACGLGNSFLRGRLEGYPNPIVTTVFAVYNAIACCMAFAVAVEVIALLPGGARLHVPKLSQIILIDGTLGALLALVCGAFIKLKREVERAQTALLDMARAQAHALQSQINPHFFFNTLNTISALVPVDPAAAQRTIGQLAGMFRYTLNSAGSESVDLAEEMQFVRDYLAIEQARFARRLTVQLPEGPWPGFRIPGLALQPLVENAVKHGIARLVEGGTVAVEVRREGERARVLVRNTADSESELSEERLFRTGHALENVRARLRLFTGEPEPLRVRRSGEWVECSFELKAAAS